MNKIKFSSLVIVAALLAGNALFAQSVEQGKKYYYYKRYKSAQEQLEKVVASSPGNAEANYWLVQTLIDNKDLAGAKAQVLKAQAANANAPLVLVATGQVELLEGKTNEARQHFETAISLSKGKDINVLNAIGKANAQKGGDPNYAIEKLNQAKELKNFRDNTTTYLYLGDAYRQLLNGGGAVKAYSTAYALDTTLAEAEYKIGMIYRTQNNPETYLPAFEAAVKADPSYAPALYELYYHWYNRDINKAAGYFDQYLANSDRTTSDEYDQTSIIYARAKYQEAIEAAKQKIADPNADPRYYRLIAYSYNELKDSVNAKSYLEQYFARQKPEDFIPKDYLFRGQLLTKFPGNEGEAFKNFQLAVDKDTALYEKISTLQEAIAVAKKVNDKPVVAQFQGQLYTLNPNATNTDLYNWGYAHYQAGNFKTSDSIFCGIYVPKYPGEIYGYLWCARSKQAQDDSVNSKGLAVEAYQKLAEVARSLDSTAKTAGTADSTRYRSTTVQAYFYLASYYNDVKKDKQSAIHYLEQVLIVDPNNSTAPRVIKMLADSGKKDTAPSGNRSSGQAAKPTANRSGAVRR